MKKTIITTMVLAIALFLAPAVAKAGTVTLTNPGFELGDKTGWFTWGGWSYVTAAQFYGGTKSLEIEDNDPSGTTGGEQDFTVSNPADFYYTAYSSWVKTTTNFGGNAKTRLQWLDSSNAVIGSAIFSTPLTGGNAWTQLSINSSAPINTAKGRIAIVVDGSGGNAFFDDASVTYNPIPEPTSMLLLGSGLVGLFGFGRKRIK